MTDGNMGGGFGMLSSAEAKVDVTNPWGDDALEREKFAKHLTNWVSSARDAPFCVAVDGGWGSGKTFFLKRWCAEFSKQGKTIYFDAWADDFHTDPLTAIIGQLWKKMRIPEWKEIYDLWEEKYIAFVMRKIMKKIFKSAVWKFVRKQKHISIIRKAIKSVLCRKYIAIVMRRYIKFFGLTKNNLQTGAGKTMGEYLQIKENVDEIKERLAILVKEIEKTGLPLVIVVDELDRCRPTFAIELLERVKHVVGVPGVVFVFGVNLKELEKSIKSVYGDIDAADYLRRFFDVGITLPQAEASKYCAYLIEKHEIDKAIAKSPVHKAKRGQTRWESDWPETVKEIPAMLGYMGLSLRQTEQIIRMWLFILRSKEVDEEQKIYQFEGSLAIFILLRIENRDMYERFFNGDCEPQEVINYLFDFLPWEEVQGDEYKKRKDCMVNIVLACYFFYAEDECSKIISEFEQVSEAKSADELLQKYRYVPQKIIEMQNNSTRQDLMLRLLHLMKYAKDARWFQNPPSREKVARFLEWGDNWQF